MRSRSHPAAHSPGAGGPMAEGVIQDMTASVAAPERAAAEAYLLTPYGWCLRAQVSRERDAPPPLPGTSRHLLLAINSNFSLI